METNKEIIVSALQMRKNKIMTGCPTLSTEDVCQMGETDAKRYRAEIKALDEYQMRLVLKINKLIERFGK